MTLPDERYRALKWAEQFMKDLLDPSKTPKVPETVRQQARGVLRHYPSEYYLDQIAKQMPGIICKEIEPVYRMIKQYESGKKESE